MRAPLECSTFQCVERERASAMMLLEMVIRCEVCARHSSGVSPVEAAPGGSDVLVGRPGQRAMIDDHIVSAVAGADGIR